MYVSQKPELPSFVIITVDNEQRAAFCLLLFIILVNMVHVKPLLFSQKRRE
jgi:hypothetical protein